ncbi:hypothetical protein [Thermoplasma sp.]|uniref:hypothetical protein n=1 Tax=Thermoplasma sp. TaxID=1973142 RepID=UPI001282E4E3|nr:hypothetical protein [Thermoplasma sp.]KAA8923410.1 MAG: hypothetical protein F6Q11_00165 [Thermoplasma sp.]
MIRYLLVAIIAISLMALSISGAMPPIAVSNEYEMPVNALSGKVYLTYGQNIAIFGNISVNNTANSSTIGSGSTIYLNAFHFFGSSILYVFDALQVNDSLPTAYQAVLWINGSIPSDIFIFAQNNTSTYILSGNNSFNLSVNATVFFSFYAISTNAAPQNFTLYFSYIIDGEIVIEYTYNFVMD